MLKIFCPRCAKQMQQAGPLQNHYDGPALKKVEMKCDGCSSLGSVWEVTVENWLVKILEFKRQLFKDFDHRS